MSRCVLGVAIAAHNSADVIRDCLVPFQELEAEVVLFDDGSTDQTAMVATQVLPGIHVLRGDGTAWWAGGTRRAVEYCLSLGCEFVLLLNPDVRLSPEGVTELLHFGETHPGTIAAALVVTDRDGNTIAWAGSRFGSVMRNPFILVHRYIGKRGQPVDVVPKEPYRTDEVHGRGVLVPSSVFQKIGNFDDRVFPHYGADVDFSHRARKAGVPMVILPQVRARLLVENSGMSWQDKHGFLQRLRGIWLYATSTRHGDALRVNWNIAKRHLPAYAVLPTFTFTIGLNVLRRLR